MVEVTNELMYELLKRMHQDLTAMKTSVSEVRVELNAMRGTMISIQQDVHNIYGVLGRHQERLERIERRLDIRELAEPQHPFDADN